jgi:hypothetical protein
MMENNVEGWVEAEEYDKIFNNSNCYVYLKLTLSDPITPTIPE